MDMGKWKVMMGRGRAEESGREGTGNRGYAKPGAGESSTEKDCIGVDFNGIMPWWTVFIKNAASARRNKQISQYAANRLLYEKIGVPIVWSGIAIDQNKVFTAKVSNQPGGGIYG